jgi:prepilin-type N-terminal cleavage/methylation domain-containing protein
MPCTERTGALIQERRFLFRIKDNDAAYTLIELTVVVFLIGIMLALAVPRIQDSFLSDDLKTATRRLIGRIREYRVQAVQEQKDYQLHFDIESNEYWWEGLSPKKDSTTEKKVQGGQKVFTLPGNIRILDVQLQGSGKESMDNVIVRFTKKGYVEPAVIHIGTKADNAHTIVLSPFLSTVKTYDEYIDIDSMESGSFSSQL